VRSGFGAHAATPSSPSRAKYAWALEHHLTELVDEQLRAIDVPRIVAHQHHLLETGRSPATVREALIYLSGIMQVAAEHGLIPANPVRAVRKTGTEREEVRPLTPLELEALIASFESRSRIIVVLAGHLGLRPVELRSVPWRGLDNSCYTSASRRPSAQRGAAAKSTCRARRCRSSANGGLRAGARARISRSSDRSAPRG
jgi:hypothetical protein